MIDKILKISEIEEEKTYTIVEVKTINLYNEDKVCLRFKDINGYLPINKSCQNDLRTLFNEIWINNQVRFYKTKITVKDKGTFDSISVHVPIRYFLKRNS